MAELDERLIDAVRAYPCLYNSRSGDFKVSLMKENAWKAVAASLERSSKLPIRVCEKKRLHKYLCHTLALCYDFVVEDVQKRWKTLREHFVRDKEKEEAYW